MTWAAIRSQLGVIVTAVSGVANVHDYQRWAAEAENFKSFFEDTPNKTIQAWMITRDRSIEDDHATAQNYRRHQIRIIGVYSLSDADATEKTFSDLLEAICDALRTDNDIGGTAESSGPPRVTRDDHTMFADVLCHFGEVSIEIREDRTY